MAKKLNPEDSKYLRAVQSYLRRGKSKLFVVEDIRRKLKIERTDSLGTEQLLEKLGYITRISYTQNLTLSTRGKNYLKWERRYYITNLFSGLNKFINNYLLDIFNAFLFFIFFIILNRFAVKFYEEKHIYNVIKELTPNQLGYKILFILLSIISFYRINAAKRKLTKWDYLVLFIWVYFKFNYSSWYVWSIFSLHSYNLLYIDVIPACYIILLTRLGGGFLKNIIIKNKKNDMGYLVLDLPLKESSEEKGKTMEDLDGLGRNKFARQIAEEIILLRPYRAFAVGINGSWGSGKTSLIDLIIEKIQSYNYKNDTLFIEFFPWYSKDTESLISHFLSLVEKTYRKNGNLSAHIHAYAKAIKVIEKKFFETEFTALLSDENSEIKSRYDSIVQEIGKENKLLIIKVDDLDRLSTNEIIDTLRLIRIIANFPNTVYLVGYDKNYINSAIEQGLTKHNPEKYIDKVFNVEFKIPELLPYTISERLKTHFLEVAKGLIGFGEGKINEIEFKQMEEFFRTNIMQLSHYIENERDIVRFTNNLFMRFLSINDEINFSDFFLLEMINYKYPNTYLDIYKNKESLTTI